MSWFQMITKSCLHFQNISEHLFDQTILLRNTEGMALLPISVSFGSSVSLTSDGNFWATVDCTFSVGESKSFSKGVGVTTDAFVSTTSKSSRSVGEVVKGRSVVSVSMGCDAVSSSWFSSGKSLNICYKLYLKCKIVEFQMTAKTYFVNIFYVNSKTF